MRKPPRLGEDAGLPGVERGAGATGWGAEEDVEPPAVLVRQRGRSGHSAGSGSRSSSTLRTLRSCFRFQSERDSLWLPPPPPLSPVGSPATSTGAAPLLYRKGLGFGAPAAGAAKEAATAAAAASFPEDNPTEEAM